MFHVTRNRPFSETELVEDFTKFLQNCLSPEWTLNDRANPLPADRGPDAMIEAVSRTGSRVTFAAEVKRKIDAKDVPGLNARRLRIAADSFSATPILLAPFLGERVREVLEADGTNYADATGNALIRVGEPAIFIRTIGASKDPWRTETPPLRSLRGPAAGRAVRALVDYRPPYGLRELAQRANVPAPTLSRVAELLERDALLLRASSRGKIVDVNWEGTLRRWARDYSAGRSDQTRTYVAPRGIGDVLRRLVERDFTYALTGSIAANALVPVTEPRAGTLFVADFRLVAKALDLTPASSGVNMILIEPFNDVVFERTTVISGLVYAGASQVVVDCLTGPGRSPSEAEALLSWMKTSEESWRV